MIKMLYIIIGLKPIKIPPKWRDFYYKSGLKNVRLKMNRFITLMLSCLRQ